MNLQAFEKLIDTLDKIDARRHAMHKLGVDILEYDDPHFEVINGLLREVFGKEGHGWISWFCWDNQFGRGGLVASRHGTPICRNVKELFELCQGAA